jgi:hypothetical protein
MLKWILVEKQMPLMGDLVLVSTRTRQDQAFALARLCQFNGHNGLDVFWKDASTGKALSAVRCWAVFNVPEI